MKHAFGATAKQPAWTVFPELEPVKQLRAEQRPARKVEAGLFTRANATAKTDRQIKTTVLSFTNMSEHGDMLVNFLRARKRTFIDHLGWDLPQTEEMEFDQYDTPFCRWVVIHEFGEVLGGIRLTPTTAKVGVYSYMLRDAQKGMLTDIPTDVLYMDAPVDKSIWEASRLFIAEDVPANRRNRVQTILMSQLMTTAQGLGASHVIGIVPAVWSRWLRRLGLGAVAVGSKFHIDKTSSQAALFSVIEHVN